MTDPSPPTPRPSPEGALMLPPRSQELLTAFVDGELTARQARLVARLLRRSGEARQLLEKLQYDSRELHLLPAEPAPAHLPDAVLTAIARRKLRPARRPRLQPAPAAPPGWAVAAAAGVLLLVSLGSFLYNSRTPGPPHGERLAARRPAPHDPAPAPAAKPPAALVQATRPHDTAKTTNVRPTPPPDDPEPEDPPAPPADPGKARPTPRLPKPALPTESVLGSAAREAPGKFERVEVALPAFFALDKIDAEAGELEALLRKSPGTRIELLCKNAARAFPHLQEALKAHHIRTLRDDSARYHLNKPQFKTDFALFVENVTPREAAAILRHAARLDRAAPAGKKAPEPHFAGRLVLKAFADADRRELQTLLGIDPTRVRPPPPRAPQINPRRPLAEGTRADVTAALAGQGVSRAAGRAAFVLTLSPPRKAPSASRLLASRLPARPGTVQLLLVLRNVGG